MWSLARCKKAVKNCAWKHIHDLTLGLNSLTILTQQSISGGLIIHALGASRPIGNDLLSESPYYLDRKSRIVWTYALTYMPKVLVGRLTFYLLIKYKYCQSSGHTFNLRGVSLSSFNTALSRREKIYFYLKIFDLIYVLIRTW